MMPDKFEQPQLFPAPDKGGPAAPDAGAGAVRAVLVPYPVERAYDYALPGEMALAPGDYVSVPLGGREVPGVVWGAASGDVLPARLKPVVRRYELRPMSAVMRRFIDWVADYTMSPRGFVLKMALPVPGALSSPIVPSRASTSRDAIASPRPVPP